MTSIRLSGSDWQCSACGPNGAEEWLAAQVPGDVHSALLAAGRISDPFFGKSNEKCLWVEDFDWWFKKDITLEPLGGKRAHLIFEGVDYLADIYLNDSKLGQHEGMFARQIYEVTNLLGEHNTLAVRLHAAKKLPKMKLNRLEILGKKLAKLLWWGDLFPNRLASLKCQMSFGWDFAPRLLTSGIWDDVYLHLSETVFIRDVFVAGEPDVDAARVGVRVELDAQRGGEYEISVTVEGANFVSEPLDFRSEVILPAGESIQDLRFRLPSPMVWQPWDRGEPNLYRLNVEVRQVDCLLDSRVTRFGIRSVEMAPNPGAPPRCADLTLIINGQREFIRGANWVPADSIFARVTADDYSQLISLAKSANVNLLRVWGGGLREKKAFYDICDAEGIMVWQEFPLACAFFDHYPSDDGFIGLLEKEAKGITRHLRNHPSLVMWCGGNEFAPSKNERAVRTMRSVVQELDGTRPFLPASPGRGDGHNWRVWHGKANVRDYLADNSILASEFGLQSAPDVASLVRFLPEGALYPPGEIWEYHSAQLDKLNRYAGPFRPRGLEAFVGATQKAQAIGLQVAIEHFRRRKGYTSGTLFWQLNEPWPAICWSVIDFYRRPKLAYNKLKDVYNPVLISLSYPIRRYRPGEIFSAEVWAINDLLRLFEDCELRLLLGDTVVHRQMLSLPADSSSLVGRVEFALGKENELRIELVEGEEVVSRNNYDLGYFDPVEITRWDAFRDWLAWRVL